MVMVLCCAMFFVTLVPISHCQSSCHLVCSTFPSTLLHFSIRPTQVACKTISNLVQRAGISDLTGMQVRPRLCEGGPRPV